MILIFLLHILIQPVYADEASPSATPVVSVTAVPTIEPSPLLKPTDTPAVTPTAIPVTPTETPAPLVVTKAPTPTPTSANLVQSTQTSTPAPTHPPVFSNQITTPTPTPKKPLIVTRIAAATTEPLTNTLTHILTIPASFLTYTQGDNYYPSTKLSQEKTQELLSLSAVLFVAGVLLIFWDNLVVLVARVLKRKEYALALEEINDANTE